MAAKRKSLERIIADLLEQLAPELAAAFRVAVQDIVDNAILNEMVEAIRNGDVEAVFRTLGFDQSAMRPITAAIERAFELGGSAVGSTFPRRLETPQGRAVYRFDVRASRAERWLRDQSSALVTRVAEDTRTNIRNVMFDGVRDGRNPKNIALDIVGRIDPVSQQRVGGIVGLTPQQERWVSRARTELRTLDPAYFQRKRRDKRFDPTIRKAIADGKPLTDEQINGASGAYKNRLLKLRGDTIGRTEAISALNRSQHEAFQQAQDMGAIKPNQAKRIWDSAGDDGRTRESHLAMDGQEVGLDEPFITPSGDRLMFPGDQSMGAAAEEIINCRCRVRIKVDWFAGVK